MKKLSLDWQAIVINRHYIAVTKQGLILEILCFSNDNGQEVWRLRIGKFFCIDGFLTLAKAKRSAEKTYFEALHKKFEEQNGDL